MAEREQQHHHAMQRLALRAESARKIGGLLAAFVIALVTIFFAGYLTLQGQERAAILQLHGGGTLVSLVTVFLAAGRDQPQRQE